MAVSEENSRVFSEQVTQLYRAAPLGIIASLINAVFLVVVLRLEVPLFNLFIWFVCLLGVSLIRAILLWQFHRTSVKTGDYERWQNLFLAGLFTIAATWGSVAIFIYPESSLAHQVFIAFLIGGMVAGAAGTLSFVPGAFLVFCVPALGPLVACFILQGDEIHILMGVILLLFSTLLFFTSRRNVKMVKSIFFLKLKNIDLIADLENTNAELKSENTKRRNSQAELEKHREHLEEMVAERTNSLVDANMKLQAEIHQRQLIEEDLQKSNRAKSEFIATASHELRTPLSSILGFSELLMEPEQFTADQQLEFTKIIQQKAEALEKIVDDLLDLSRGESGHPILLEKRRTDICQLIRHEVNLFQRSSSRHQIKTIFVDESLELSIDVKKVEQILENLLSNAVKYSPKGGAIVVKTQKQGDYFVCSVSDSGIGMTPDQVDKVFDKFYRADTSNTAVAGLGLGMSIVKQIVEIHGGRIWVQSERGQGTTIFFTLPLEEELGHLEEIAPVA